MLMLGVYGLSCTGPLLRVNQSWPEDQYCHDAARLHGMLQQFDDVLVASEKQGVQRPGLSLQAVGCSFCGLLFKKPV